MPRLLVTIGPNRFETEIAHVNDATRPTAINTPEFIGRVLVRIKDFDGVPPVGGVATRDSSYFDGRTRKFSILIEGRFKARAGVAPYTGQEIEFGSDFDHIFTTFPRGPFNTGMRIAQWIDPATRYEETPPSGRPYIMSPYLACMNSVAAYPAPSSFSKALLLAHHPHVEDQPLDDGEEDMVPISVVGDGTRKEKQYWRFVGLKGNAPVDAFLKKYEHLLPSPSSSRPSTPSPTAAPSGNPPLLLRRLGSTTGFDQPMPLNAEDKDAEDGDGTWGAAIRLQAEAESIATVTPTITVTKEKKFKPSRFSLATLKSALDRHQDDGLHAGDLTTADNLKRKSWGNNSPDGRPRSDSRPNNVFDAELGVWRFGEEGVDVLEDTTFIFLDPSKPHTVAQRRKHFCTEAGKHRKTFTYDPEVVYATSFFSNFCDFNTFDLKMGPLNLNIASHFADQPVRYTLRSTRMVPTPDGSGGPEEEETFVTISFQLVD